jgi:hypothetical protein
MFWDTKTGPPNVLEISKTEKFIAIASHHEPDVSLPIY